MTYRPARKPRGLRRLLARLGALAVALAIALTLVSLMFIGERWVLVEAPTSVLEFGAAVTAANAGGVH
jgi:hypothetical protein